MVTKCKFETEKSPYQYIIGRWGRLTIYPAYYIYVGSAFGPGGVKARVSRHFRETKAKPWHIDYLREFVSPVCAWYMVLLRTYKSRASVGAGRFSND